MASRVPHRPAQLGAEAVAGRLGERERPRCRAGARDHVSERPRDIAISPVRIISTRPYGRTTRSNASTFSRPPVISTVI